MAFTKINLDEEANLEFELAIEGIREGISEIRFVVEGDQYKVGFNGSYTNGTLSIPLPVLEHVISPGEKKCYLEVVADQKFFVPLKETIEFVAPIRVESTQPKKKEVREEVSVSVKTTNVVKEAKQPELVEQDSFEGICKEKKYRLVESKTHTFAKDENDKYVGVKSKSSEQYLFFNPASTIKEALGLSKL